MQLMGAKGGKGGGGAARAAQEDANTLRSVATARIVDYVSEGEISGLVAGLQSVYFDGVPVQNLDGTFNFKGVQVDERVGTPSQTSVPGFAAVESESVVDQEVLLGSPVERTITDADVDAVRVKLVIPTLTKQDSDDGDLHGYSVSVAVDVQSNGSEWKEVLQNTVRGKTTADYEKQFRVEKPLGGVPWLVRLRRVSADHGNDATIQDQTWFSSYTEVIDAKLSYPNSAYFAITIDADQFGEKVPKRSYDVRGLIVQVPSNYNPQTRDYAGIWDGTFQLAWTDNPAWVLYDLVCNDRYGLGEYVDVARVNKGALYQIAQYCDELVLNGFGGYQPRYTFNAQIRTQDDAFTLLRKVASAFRAVNYYGSGTLNFVQDAPSDAVAIVSPANVIGGQFRYSSKSLKTRATAVLTTYSNPADGGRPAIDVWEDADAIAQFGWRQRDIVAFGSDSVGQARRLGRFEVDADQTLTRSVRYQCGLDQLFVRPGDVVGVQDPAIAGARLSGRARSANGAVLSVDALPADLPLAYSYTLRYVAVDGSLQARAVTTIELTENTITADTELGEIVVGAMWVLSAAEVELPLYRIRSLMRGDGDMYTVEADQYDPHKYARIEQGLVFDDPDFSLLPEGPIPAPTNLSFLENLYRDNASIKTALTVSVTPSSDPRAGYVQFQYALSASAGWQSFPIDSDPQINLRELRDQQIVRVRARTVSRLGQMSPWLTADHYTVQGKLLPPTQPENVSGVVLPENGIELSKNASNDVDYKETAWWVGDAFVGAVELHRGAGNRYLWGRVPAGSYTVWAVDYDTGGRASNPVSVALVVDKPAMPVVSFRFEGADVVLEWAPVVSTFAIKHYEVGYDDVLLTQALATSVRALAAFESARTYTVVAVDIADNRGPVTSIEVVLTPPGQPNVVAAFEGPNVRLSWAAVAAELGVQYYEITDGGEVVAEVDANAYTLPVLWWASRVFGVTAVDAAGNRGLEGTVSVAVDAPTITGVDAVFEGGRVVFVVASVAGSVPIDVLEVYLGVELLASVSADTWSLDVSWVGAREFTFKLVDVAENSSATVNFTVSPQVPLAPDVSGQFVGRRVELVWPVPAGDLSVAYYSVQNGAAQLRVEQPGFVAEVDWLGARDILITAFDSAGNASAEASYTVNPSPPSAGQIVSEVIDNNVLFYYGAVTGSLPIDRYELKKGVDLPGAANIASKAGSSGFTTYFEKSAGIYTYWLIPVDSAGNEGGAVSTIATVSQPPDYVLFAQYSDREQGWLGAFDSAVLSQSGSMLAPVDAAETWQDYINNGYATLQGEIDAGYGVFALPGPTLGSYERVIDYGTVLSGSLITASASPDLVSGTLNASMVLSYSNDGVTWVDGAENQLQIYGTHFQFVKVRGEYNGDGDDLVEVQDIQIKLDRKLRRDAGNGAANAGDGVGTRVYFNAQFVDVTSVNITPKGSVARVPVYDFVDAPNPEYFDVYLFDTNGARVSGDFSWVVEGF